MFKQVIFFFMMTSIHVLSFYSICSQVENNPNEYKCFQNYCHNGSIIQSNCNQTYYINLLENY